MIKRQLETTIKEKLGTGKVIIVTGPRQVGKTTLVRKILAECFKNFVEFTGDDAVERAELAGSNKQTLARLAEKYDAVFIDEAQKIPGIGNTAKLIIDTFPSIQLILSGSSSFELTQKVHEPLTGRKWSYHLWPISWVEWENYTNPIAAKQSLQERLVFGFYPDVVLQGAHQKETLLELSDSYLYKDVLSYAGIRKPDIIQKLLQALAHQVGSEVVYSELAKLIGIDAKTVANYIDLLEKAFVIFRLPSFSRNLRNEIKLNKKIYFYDNGVRNAIISALQPLNQRSDVGKLWENFLISERKKQLEYTKSYANSYFWRTKQQQEVDYIEEKDGKLLAFEFKWNPNKQVKFPKTFTVNYEAETELITRENMSRFVGESF